MKPGPERDVLLRRAAELRREARGYLDARVSLGRGFRNLTDEYLAKANARELAARELENLAQS